jgi:hypothetical protein
MEIEFNENLNPWKPCILRETAKNTLSYQVDPGKSNRVMQVFLEGCIRDRGV